MIGVAKTLILVAALGWLGKIVVDSVEGVRNGDLVLQVRPEWLAMSGACTLATYLLLIWAWRYIVVQLSGDQLPYLTSCRIWFISNLLSQLPGKVWGIIQMGAMSTAAGLNPVSAGAAAIINTLVNIATGLAVGAIAGASILAAAFGDYAKWAWVIATMAVVGVVALPALVPWAFRIARKLGVSIPQQHVPPRVIAVSATINVVAWAMYGVAFLCLNRGLVELPSYDVLQHIAVNATSYVVGYLAIIVPGGLGVRESALMKAMVTAGMANPAQAAAVSVVSRLWQLIILIVPALIFLAYRRPPNEKDPAG